MTDEAISRRQEMSPNNGVPVASRRRRRSTSGGWRSPLSTIVATVALMFLLLTVPRSYATTADGAVEGEDDPARFLTLGDEALSVRDDPVAAAEHYLQGVNALEKQQERRSDGESSDDDADPAAAAALLLMDISLRTNYGTALSSVEGSSPKVLEAYRSACRVYEEALKSASKEGGDESGAHDDHTRFIASQAFHFLGMTYHDVGRVQEAAMSYGRGAELDRMNWSALANLGALLSDMASTSAAEAEKEGAVSNASAMFDESIQAYQMAIDVLTGAAASADQDSSSERNRPTDPPEPEHLREVLSILHHRIGSAVAAAAALNPKRKCATRGDPTKARSCKESAAHEFDYALKYDPNNEVARDELNRLTVDVGPMFTEVGDGGAGEESGDEGEGESEDGRRDHAEYVKGLFEGYADSFEHSLVDELNYDGFHRMRAGFDRSLASAAGDDSGQESDVKIFETVVDAGCGTGLAGEVFRNISKTLIGVDLSPSIIERAKIARPGLYDDFAIGDVSDTFREREGRISLIVAADAYIYFADLDHLFGSMETGLEDGGLAVFSMENVSVENEKSLNKIKPDWRWQLTSSGRFAHRKEYVESVGKSHSLSVFHYETLDDFREESGVGVRGHMFVMQRMARDAKDGEL